MGSASLQGCRGLGGRRDPPGDRRDPPRGPPKKLVSAKKRFGGLARSVAIFIMCFASGLFLLPALFAGRAPPWSKAKAIGSGASKRIGGRRFPKHVRSLLLTAIVCFPGGRPFNFDSSRPTLLLTSESDHILGREEPALFSRRFAKACLS